MIVEKTLYKFFNSPENCHTTIFLTFIAKDVIMKLFKHGENLAVMIPESLKKRNSLNENDDFEIMEIEKNCFLIVSKASLAEQAKKNVFLKLVEKAMKNETTALPSQSEDKYAAKTAPQYSNPISPALMNSRENYSPNPSSSLSSQIFAKGFIILEREEEARDASKQLEELIKQQKIIGVRGFDKKFYIVSSNYYDRISRQILPLLAERKLSTSDISSQTNVPEEGVTAVLQILKDKGEIIESRKNLFESIK